MPWVPIAESGVDWVFVSDYAELDGSDVVAEAQLGPWTISFSEPQTVRATEAIAAGTFPGTAAITRWCA